MTDVTLIGVDEAGFGPKLGPLVVVASVFSAPAALDGGRLWGALKSAVARKPSARNHLIVCDSKKAYSRGRGLKRLEETALAFAFPDGLPDAPTLGHLVERLGLDPTTFSRLPWYAPETLSLPAAAFRSRIREKRERLQRALEKAKVSARKISGRIITARRFNAGIGRTDNKHTFHVDVVGDLVRDLVETAPTSQIRVESDKLGGRAHYGPMLYERFPDGHLKIQEQGSRSAYHLDWPERHLQIAFTKQADGNDFCVALSSMIAKYLRELFMKQLNAYWQAKIPHLRPTAGYPNDATRFLEEIQDVRSGLDIPDQLFVRCR